MTASPTASMNRIGYLSEKAHTMPPGEVIPSVKAFFDENKPISAVVVTEGFKPVGLVMNIHLNFRLSQRYGYSLFSKKTVASIMDAAPMMVRHDESIANVADKAMQRQGDTLYDHIIVQKNGYLHGIVPVRTILNSLVRSQRDRTDILERYTTRLEQEDCEKKKAIQGLEESEKMLQLVIDAIPHAIFWKDRNSVYLGCNKKFAEDAGVKKTEDIRGLKDANLPWTEREAALYRQRDRDVMEQGRAGRDMHQVQTNAQGKKRFLNSSKIPLRGSNGNVAGGLCFNQDITRQLRDDTERMKLQMQLAQAQKMESIGRLAGGG